MGAVFIEEEQLLFYDTINVTSSFTSLVTAACTSGFSFPNRSKYSGKADHTLCFAANIWKKKFRHQTLHKNIFWFNR